MPKHSNPTLFVTDVRIVSENSLDAQRLTSIMMCLSQIEEIGALGIKQIDVGDPRVFTGVLDDQ